MRITSSSEGGNSYLLQLLSITRLAYFAASNEKRILNSCISSKIFISSDRSSVVYPTTTIDSAATGHFCRFVSTLQFNA